MKEYTYGADMGSIKIMSESMSCFFDNEVGDGEYQVFVLENKEELENEKDLKFMGHFTIITEGYLMAFDCSKFVDGEKQHKFTSGRYFVYLDKKNTILYIKKEDEETHS